MPTWIPISEAHLLVGLLVFSRIGSLLAAVSVLATRHVPLRLRLLLAAVVSILVTPIYWDQPPKTPADMAELLSMFVGEVVIGLWFALTIVVISMGTKLAGHLIAHLSGLSLIESSPSTAEGQSPAFSRLVDGISVCAFLALGGHRYVVRSLLDAFHWIPPGAARIGDGISFSLAEILTRGFSLGLRLGAPVIVAALASSLMICLLGRTMPAINFFTVGANINIIVTLGMTALVLGTFTLILQEELETFASLLTRIGSVGTSAIGPVPP